MLYVALTIGPPSEDTGEVKGFSFVYSGNFLFEAELSEMGRLRINMGVNPMGFQWHLEKGNILHSSVDMNTLPVITDKNTYFVELVSGQSFSTPEAILVRSHEGLGGMSRVFHRLFNDHLIVKLPDWALQSPPILLNTWEAKYFDIDANSVIEMSSMVRITVKIQLIIAYLIVYLSIVG